MTAGCEGDDGAPGADGAVGVACRDLNGNGIGDPEEDLNGDDVVDILDCNAIAGGAYEVQKLHAGYFTENEYTGTEERLVQFNARGKPRALYFGNPERWRFEWWAPGESNPEPAD